MQMDCISGAAGLPVWAAVLRPDWFTQHTQNSVSDPRHDWAGDLRGFFVWLWQSCAWTNCCTIEIPLAKVRYMYTFHLTLGFFCFFFLMSCDRVRDFHTIVEGFWYAQGRLGLLEQVAGTRSHLAKSLLPTCVWKKGLRGGGCVWKKSLLVTCKRLLGLSWTAWE